MKSSFPAEESLKIILKFAQKKKIKLYLVGGILRDMLLGRKNPNPDIDFCLNEGAINFGRLLSRKLEAGFVVLDKQHGACRLVKKINGQVHTFDFTDFRAATLKQDLLHRDFTINAIALELENAFTPDAFKNYLIDPYCGRKDLVLKIIRPVQRSAFDEDPLRLLRAFSFSCILDFQIDKEAIKLIKSKKDKLALVSGERIRDELFKILRTQYAHSCLVKLDNLRLLEVIFPEIKFMRKVKQGPYHHLDVWEHSIETLRQLEMAIMNLGLDQRIQGYLGEIISSDRKRMALMKLGALFHDVGKPRARRRVGRKIVFHGHERAGLGYVEDIVKRLKLSNDELGALKKMVLWHLRPGYLADNTAVTPRAIFRFYRDTAVEAVSVLLISLADQRSTRGPLTTPKSRSRHEKLVVKLIKEYFIRKEKVVPPRIINGNDLMRKFALKPSILIGRILREVEELQAVGEVKTRDEAFKVAKRLIKKNDPKKKAKIC